MIDFLSSCYPVKRIKVDGRFRRIMIIYTGRYLLSDNDHLKDAAYALLTILDKVFGYNNEELIKTIIGSHLVLK